MKSMTGFAAFSTSHALGAVRLDLDWDLRAVNGKALDLRLRLPEAFGFAEKPVRDLLSGGVARGNVTLSLRLRVVPADRSAQVDPAALDALLDALSQIAARAQDRGMALPMPSTLDILNARQLAQSGQDSATFDPTPLLPALLADAARLLDAFNAMRAAEGAELARSLRAQADQLDALCAQARALLGDRAQAMRAQLAQILAQLLDNPRLDPARLEQELALAAVKADVIEELDRLDAHIAALRAALGSDAPVGRKLDFLMQEFNREANTLCSKANHLDLTRIGLDMKGLIDQMREQVQNLE